MITIDDLLIITIILWLILIFVILLNYVKNREKNMDAIKKARKDMIDLEAITKNIEENYKPAIINLTSYEQEQENNAIISYEELVSNKDNKAFNYDDSFFNESDVDVKKVNLKEDKGSDVLETKINVSLMNYEMEEAFLKALKQLKIDLAR